MQTKEEIQQEVNVLRTESNAEATDRISNELRAEKKLNERRDCVMDFFFEITGMPMPLAWFEEYNEIFNKAKKGYNIKSFIWGKQQEILKYWEFMKGK